MTSISHDVKTVVGVLLLSHISFDNINDLLEVLNVLHCVAHRKHSSIDLKIKNARYDSLVI